MQSNIQIKYVVDHVTVFLLWMVCTNSNSNPHHKSLLYILISVSFWTLSIVPALFAILFPGNKSIDSRHLGCGNITPKYHNDPSALLTLLAGHPSLFFAHKARGTGTGRGKQGGQQKDLRGIFFSKMTQEELRRGADESNSQTSESSGV